MRKCDAVFQGGGVKGIAFAGAVSAIERAGYEFVNVAGTSAGAIVAALLAVGYTGDEIQEELMRLDYTRFRESTLLDRFGLIGKALNLGLFLGIYKTDYFETWFNGLLERKGKTVFSDILTGFAAERYKYKFQAIASDVTRKRMLVLPTDLAGFGIDPGSFSIARAVRMSMSIPFYFIPYKLKGTVRKSLIVDGGLLSNYPVWLLDDGTNDPKWPTFGFRFQDSVDDALHDEHIETVYEYCFALIETLLDAHDNYEAGTLQRGDLMRSIVLSADIVTEFGTHKMIKTTDFDIAPSESKALFDNGVAAAERFLEQWDFESWKRMYRYGSKAHSQ